MRQSALSARARDSQPSLIKILAVNRPCRSGQRVTPRGTLYSAWCGVVRGVVCDEAWCGLVWCVVWCGMAWCCVVWFGVVRVTLTLTRIFISTLTFTLILTLAPAVT